MGSLVSGEMETESATSERSSRDDKPFEELLEVVTHAVIRLKLRLATGAREAQTLLAG